MFTLFVFGYTINIGDSMKRFSLLFIMIVFGFCFVSCVNADELELDKVAAITATIGGSDKEIIQIDTKNSYTYYYKYVKIGDKDFNDYVKNKKIVDESTDGSNEYIAAASKVGEYEKSFLKLIPTVSKASDVSNWIKSTNNEINVSNLIYKSGNHNGYVLAVAAVKSGDTNVYISRVILESKSTSTLGLVSGENVNPDTSINTNTNTNTSNNDTRNIEIDDTDTVNTGDTTTEENPNTGLNDYALYLAPVAIILGSAILLRKNYA